MKRMTGSIIIPRAVLAIAAAMVLTLLCVSSARAQVDAGSILGTVTDASGSAVRGATVTLTNEGTNAALSTTWGQTEDTSSVLSESVVTRLPSPSKALRRSCGRMSPSTSAKT